ncbi:hypothetical protein Thein_0313 [Thermodesulfatator indicus DSM 15286]|uniref:Uncharacterized protein n=2 Tax=Thermodesulfatator indicus TaxID=171695 RepID=F8A9Z2_THEID|nr:hypothetical protein Thein_0313 [Thermodesulfatator indicus DSM 15286]
MMGLVCYHHGMETLAFVLEKREFFDLEWPALVAIDAQGWHPIPLGIEYVVMQRANIIWYTTQIPEILVTQYRERLPIKPDKPPEPPTPEPPKPTRNKKEKIVRFPGLKK